MLSLCIVTALVESATPPEGLLRSLVRRRHAAPGPVLVIDGPTFSATPPSFPPDAPVASRATPATTFDKAAWAQASFVLVNPEHYAVGIRNLGDRDHPFYRLVAKGEDETAKQAQMLAWDMRSPIIANDPALARRIFHTIDVDRNIPEALATEVRRLLAPQVFVPANPRVVSFRDTRLRRTRTGFLLAEDNQGLAFSDLIPTHVTLVSPDRPDAPYPFKMERIDPATRIATGSRLDDLGDAELRGSVDFLDWCVYNILQNLQAHQSRPVYLYVDDVKADVEGSTFHPGEVGLAATKRAFQSTLSRLDVEVQQAYRRSDPPRNLMDLLLKTLDDYEKKRQWEEGDGERREELRRDAEAMRAEIGRLQTLVARENSLAGEIRSRLVRAGVLQVERSERAKEIYAQKVSGEWLRPGSAEAFETRLVAASHVLITEIRTPERLGMYQLSMRLIDVHSGVILWEDQGDRQPPADVTAASAVEAAPGSGTRLAGERHAGSSTAERGSPSEVARRLATSKYYLANLQGSRVEAMARPSYHVYLAFDGSGDGPLDLDVYVSAIVTAHGPRFGLVGGQLEKRQTQHRYEDVRDLC